MANKHQFENICGLRWTAANGTRRTGTGFLVGPRHVLTVAHNLFDPELGGDSMQPVVAQFPGDQSGAEHDVVEFKRDLTTQWRDRDSHSSNRFLSAFDIGILVLNSGPAGAVKPFALELPNPSDMVAMAGYPSRGVSWPMFTEFQAEAGPLIPNPFPSFGGRIFYELFKDINIVLGMSGGPVWRVDANGQPIRNANGQPVAIGLHTSFINVQNGIESGMEMTEDLIELVNGWLKL